MKKYFESLIKSKGYKITEYTHVSGIEWHQWFINVEDNDGCLDDWYGEYFVHETNSKDEMKATFEKWVSTLGPENEDRKYGNDR